MNFELPKATWGRKYHPNGTFPEDNVEMFICSLHKNDPISVLKKEKLLSRQIFDEHELNNYLSYAKVPSNDASEIVNRAYDAIVEANVTNSGMELYCTAEIFPTVYRFSGSAKLIEEALEEYFKKCQNDEYWASGDDSYFDYTPDLVEVIYQICSVLRLEDFWKRFLSWAVSTWYIDQDDDPLGVDEDIREQIMEAKNGKK